MKTLKILVLIYFLVLLVTSCSKVGALISNTGDFVSRTGEIIGGKSSSPKRAKYPAAVTAAKKKPRVHNKPVSRAKITVSKPSTVSIKIKTTKNVNPSASGKPSRIKITVLQLKSAGKFSSSRVSFLQGDLESALGADFISQESISLLPEKDKSLRLVLDPSTRVLGVFGSFRQLNNTVWKTMVNLPKGNNKSYSVQVFVDSKRISARKK